MMTMMRNMGFEDEKTFDEMGIILSWPSKLAPPETMVL